MTLRAVLLEENGSGSEGVRIVLQRICAEARFFRSFLQFRVNGRIVFHRRRLGRLARIRALRKSHRHRQ